MTIPLRYRTPGGRPTRVARTVRPQGGGPVPLTPVAPVQAIVGRCPRCANPVYDPADAELVWSCLYCGEVGYSGASQGVFLRRVGARDVGR